MGSVTYRLQVITCGTGRLDLGRLAITQDSCTSSKANICQANLSAFSYQSNSWQSGTIQSQAPDGLQCRIARNDMWGIYAAVVQFGFVFSPALFYNACSQAFWCQDSPQTASILSIWRLAPVSSNTYVSLPAALREMMKQRMWRDQSTKWSENPYAGCIRPAQRRFYFFFHCSWMSFAVSKCSCRNHQEIRYLHTVRPSFLG